MLFFKWFFLQWKAYSRVHIVWENCSRIWLGRLIAQAMPNWDIALFLWYTTWAWLGLLVFCVFYSTKMHHTMAHIASISECQYVSFSPYSNWENDDAPNRIFGCTMVVFHGANCTKFVPFCCISIYLRSHFYLFLLSNLLTVLNTYCNLMQYVFTVVLFTIILSRGTS